jgi:heptaprenyl diphosphate synthase
MGNKNKTKKLVTISILLSISIVLSIVEPAFLLGVPGAKLGLANIITLVVLYLYTPKDAALLLFLRVFLVGLVYSGIWSLTFQLSLGGGTLAVLLMILVKKTNRFTIISVSVMGSLGHATGQIFVAMMVMSTPFLVYYLPVLFMMSVPAGLFIGYTSKMFIKRANDLNLIETAEN